MLHTAANALIAGAAALPLATRVRYKCRRYSPLARRVRIRGRSVLILITPLNRLRVRRRGRNRLLLPRAAARARTPVPASCGAPAEQRHWPARRVLPAHARARVRRRRCRARGSGQVGRGGSISLVGLGFDPRRRCWVSPLAETCSAWASSSLASYPPSARIRIWSPAVPGS
ncbi:hypothetical protein FB451DRAFT_1370565 [Mycena latifolia]|nr:hypothetical protein FB451DRAFT_1370565 [Mycena latifolia]